MLKSDQLQDLEKDETTVNRADGVKWRCPVAGFSISGVQTTFSSAVREQKAEKKTVYTQV
jgi:hypothetical protein